MSAFGFNPFGFDPEVPAGYQDADIEMRELEEQAAEDAKSQAICYGCRDKWPERLLDENGRCPFCRGGKL